MTAPIDEFTDPPPEPEATRRQIAVALAHQLGSDGAPEVVASGHGAVAEQILQIAFAAGVKVRTDPDLASLLSLVEVGEEIPAEAFVAVAEVLAYVYRAGTNANAGAGEGAAVTAAAQADRLAETLGRIDTAMSAAEAQVAAGGRVDLAGLDVQIAQICGTLPDLAPGDRHRLLGPLGGLIDRCDALAAALTAALELARKTTGPSPQQVARAYGGSGGAGSASSASSGNDASR